MIAINTNVRNLLPPKRTCHHHRKLSNPIRINGTVVSVIATPVTVLGTVTRNEEMVSNTTIMALWRRSLFELCNGIGFMFCLTINRHQMVHNLLVALVDNLPGHFQDPSLARGRKRGDGVFGRLYTMSDNCWQVAIMRKRGWLGRA